MAKEIKTKKEKDITKIVESLSPNERTIIPFLNEDNIDEIDKKTELGKTAILRALEFLSNKNIILLSDTIHYLNNEKKVTFVIVEHRIKECIKFSERIIGLKLGSFFCEHLINSEFNIKALKSIFI